jgi:replicative DNA helicase
MSHSNGYEHRNGDGPVALASPADRLPPHNLRAEREALGAVLLGDGGLDEVAPLLSPDDFYRASHRTIFEAILRLSGRGAPTDLVAVEEELRRAGELDRVGGFEALAEILDGCPGGANAAHCASIVRQKARVRGLIAAANGILRGCYADDRSADQLIAEAEREVLRLGDAAAAPTGPVPLRVAAERAVARIAARGHHAYGGLPTGFRDLDDLTDGMGPGQVVIVAARPGMGKTSFALNACEHAALKKDATCLVFSLEMDLTEIGERFLSARARVDSYKLKNPHWLKDDHREAMAGAQADAATAPILIDDRATLTMPQIAAEARRVRHRRGSLGLVVVDYIQLVGVDAARGTNRQEQVASISRDLKRLAKDLACPVLAMSQLNRLAEHRDDRRPRLSDLRESGAIEQDADVVILLHRPEYYDPNDRPGIAEVIVAKNRNGKTATVELVFLRDCARFDNLAVPLPLDPGADYAPAY